MIPGAHGGAARDAAARSALHRTAMRVVGIAGLLGA
jgi:hypothetical protein